MFLVDTSVWIEVFRKPSRFDLRSVAGLDEVVTCLPIIQEVLQGFRDESAFRLAREAMFSFPVVESPLRGEIFEEAAQLYRAARRAGITIRSSVDCLIAVCALRHGLAVLHADRDFSRPSSSSRSPFEKSAQLDRQTHRYTPALQSLSPREQKAF